MEEGCQADNSSESDSLYPSAVPSEILVKVSESSQVSNLSSIVTSSSNLPQEQSTNTDRIEQPCNHQSRKRSSGGNTSSNSSFNSSVGTISTCIYTVLDVAWSILSICLSWLTDDEPCQAASPKRPVIDRRPKVSKGVETASQTDPSCFVDVSIKKKCKEISQPVISIKTQETQTCVSLKEKDQQTLKLDAENNIVSNQVIYYALPANSQGYQLIHREPVRVIPAVKPTIPNQHRNQTFINPQNDQNQFGNGSFQFNRPPVPQQINLFSPQRNEPPKLAERPAHFINGTSVPQQFHKPQERRMSESESERAKEAMRRQWRASQGSAEFSIPAALIDENDSNEEERGLVNDHLPNQIHDNSHHINSKRPKTPKRTDQGVGKNQHAATLSRHNSPHLNENYQPSESSRKARSRQDSKRPDNSKIISTKCPTTEIQKKKIAEKEEKSQSTKGSQRHRSQSQDCPCDNDACTRTKASKSQKTFDRIPTSNKQPHNTMTDVLPEPQFFIPLNAYPQQLARGQQFGMSPVRLHHHPFTVAANPGQHHPLSNELSLPMDTPLYSLQLVRRDINPAAGNQLPVTTPMRLQQPPQQFVANHSNGSHSSGGGSSGYLCEDERSEDSHAVEERERLRKRRQTRKRHSKKRKQRSPDDSNSDGDE